MKKMAPLFMVLAITVSVALLATLVVATVSLDVTWQTAVSELRPGADTTISLAITNTGTSALTNVVITPSGGPDISVTSGKIELGGLGASSSQACSIAIKAAKDAESRTSYVHLDVDYYTGASSYTKIFKIPISIKREPILQIINVKYNDTVAPGRTLVLNFDVKNSGLGPANDLVVTLNQSDLYTIPGSAGEIVIDEIDTGDKVTISFIITIDPDADVGINSIPVTLGYYDETNVNEYSNTKYIGMTVSGDIDFIVTVSEAMGNMATISITNIGTSSAEYALVKVTANGVSNEYYIGSIDTDDTETIEFPQPKQSGKYEADIEIVYRDEFNNEFTETKKITVDPSIQISKTSIIVLIIILAAGYWYYKRKYKKK